MTEVDVRWSGRNWAGNYASRAVQLHRPGTTEQLQELAATLPQLHVLVSRHSFTGIVDSAELVSLEAMTGTEVVVAPDRRTVTVDAGLRYGELSDALGREGLRCTTWPRSRTSPSPAR